MTSSLFPDVNVWVALTHERHAHHGEALRWFESLQSERLYFCRFTQLGLLRLLTDVRVMGVDLLNQRAAWRTYDKWLDDARICFHREPEAGQFEILFRQYTSRSQSSTKQFADAYLAAFAQTAGLTIVTFDRAFRTLARAETIVLESV